MPENQKFGKRMVQAGVITQEQLDDAIQHQSLEEGRLGELLVRLGYVSESTILQFLAAEFRTRYVSTERLARARIPQQVLDLLPVQLAERYNLIPVLFDTDTQTLSVVTSEPQNEDNLREVHMLTSVRELRVYVALQPAVHAAIRKHYRGEINAFAELVYHEGEAVAATATGYAGQPPANNYNPNFPTGYAPVAGQARMSEDYLAGSANMYGAMSPRPYEAAPAYPATPTYGDPYAYNYNTAHYESNYPYENPPSYAPAYENAYPENYQGEGARIQQPYSVNEGDYAGNQAYYYQQHGLAHMATQAPNDYMPFSPMMRIRIMELIRFLVEQAEQLTPRYKRHVSSQHPIMETLLRRLQVSPEEGQPLWLALYLHHSHQPLPHPSLLQLEPDAEATKKFANTHQKLVDTFRHLQLPDETLDAIAYKYERYDGKGFPSQLKQEEIPLGARILAILDTLEDLSFSHPTMSFGGILTKLKEHKDLFDPKLLEILTGEQKRIEQFKQGTIPNILLLDPDIHLVNELDKFLWDRGFWVQTAHTLSQADLLCDKDDYDLVVLELDLGPNQDVFAWIEGKKRSLEKPPEFIILTQRQDDLERGMALARDYLVKPMSANIIVAKLSRQLSQIESEKKQRTNKGMQGLAGSLEHLGLPEILQVLSQSRRSGRLTIHGKSATGYIYLEEGEVNNAMAGDIGGEPAFGIMMAWNEGEFGFEPGVTTTERLINKRLDGLILDSLRVLDESRRDGIDDPFASFSSSSSLPDVDASKEMGEDFFDLSLSDDEIESPDPKEKSAKP